LFADPGAGDLAVKVFDSAQCAKQPPDCMEGDVAGMGFAEGRNHLDPASGRGRRGLPRHPAFADAGFSHHIHHATAAIACAVHHGV
jgi:hypothetical protein